jgi:hypothetical protein
MSELNFLSGSPTLIYMTIDLRKMAILMIFLSSSLSASSLTFLVDTRDEMPRADMEMDQLRAVVSFENGVMDMLFDEGHIFFNINTVLGGSDAGKADEKALEYAGDEGANVLLVLTLDDQGAAWTLFQLADPESNAAGYVDLPYTDPEKKTPKHWTSLGILLADEVMDQLR